MTEYASQQGPGNFRLQFETTEEYLYHRVEKVMQECMDLVELKSRLKKYEDAEKAEKAKESPKVENCDEQGMKCVMRSREDAPHD